MSFARRFGPIRGLAVLALLAASAAPVHALTPYDSPTLTLVRSGTFAVVLELRAGATGAPAGFTVQWATLDDFRRRGGWPAEEDPAIRFCDFTGEPTVQLGTGTTSYRLEPGARIRVEPGALFDATGVATDQAEALQPGTGYVFRACVRGDAAGARSEWTGTLRVVTFSAECTQGFWKTHPEAWPPGAAPMRLGTVSYGTDELLQILQSPAKGNGLVSLGHQLITARLNLANGSDPAPLGTALADADALIGALVVPNVGTGFLDPLTTDALMRLLDDYNNGRIVGVLPCTTGVSRTTWGALKSLYR